MIVMTGNNSIFKEYGYSNIGLLMSPPKFSRCVNSYALDNRRYACAIKNKQWNKKEFFCHLDKAAKWAEESGNYPSWVVCPDVPFNSEATNREWVEWFPIIKAYGFNVAFAIQDGHTPSDVPANADTVFIGGSTNWKRGNIALFCNCFEKVHVARINTGRWLWVCHHAGARSVDGTGWVWKNKPEYKQLIEYLEITNGKRKVEEGALFHLGNFTCFGDIKGSFAMQVAT